MSNGLKLLMLAAGTVITCIVITIAFRMAKTSQNTSNAYEKNLTRFYDNLSESELTAYDGVCVYGADVVNFIKKQLGKYKASEKSDVTITVVTMKSPEKKYSYQNSNYIEQIQNFTEEHYINPLYQFRGKCIYNENDVITEIVFTVEN